ncbi:hypothetical protein ACFO3D_10225 [Virgibacillus kekensis]|uniref:Spore coat protein n=1 Tax=Virgibacillus kekensis TaxID=202261 RepID=A0ABV9DLY4_9BACI
MKFFFMVFGLLFVSVLPNQTMAEEDTNTPSSEIIEKYKEDVTGDSHKETILLEGTKLTNESDYFMDTWVKVTTEDGDEWKIGYEGGYDPALQFIDFNHDGVADIFYQSATGGSGGLHYYHLHTLNKHILKEISLPVQRYVSAAFLNNFKVKIQLNPEDDPIYKNVKNRFSEYIRLGIYNKEGKVLGNNSPMIDPIALYEPVLISEQKGYGLKSYQQISGAYHADQLGTIETLWYYEKGKWIILKTEWVSSG